jgi:hypothetical protein
MVYLFEKPKFRDAVKAMPFEDKEMLVIGLKEFLHGDEEQGFNLSLQVLLKYRVAKWPLLTVCPCYYRPILDLLIKPTTVKNIIKNFEVEGLIYHSPPSYNFYKSYRELINSMKKEVDSSLSPDNAAFSAIGNRWVMDVFGLRKDTASAKLYRVLPNGYPFGLWLLFFPGYLRYKIRRLQIGWILSNLVIYLKIRHSD